MEPQKFDAYYSLLKKQWEKRTKGTFDNLANEAVFKQHADLVIGAGNVQLANENKTFVIDNNNRMLMRFLLLYFNGQKEAENVFPDREYKLHKSLIICGDVGVGKTLIMQAFSEYLKMTGNPNAFHNVSVTQMINYFKQHEHLDLYTYNEANRKGFDGCQPENLCLNDVGLQTAQHFGQDTKQLIMDFFHARTEVYNQYRVKTHVTTNMSPSEIKDYFSNDEYGRLVDRLKFYNIIHMNGESRRK